ncbi:MAG: hypothetical protein ABFD92_20380 [Planctomycetaceae bacterium]|nr:hypothetical protein [Planctomycetaceae bacterium]
MSLINDALKRAELEKPRLDPAMASPLRELPSPSGRSSLAAKSAVGALLLGAAALATLVITGAARPHAAPPAATVKTDVPAGAPDVDPQQNVPAVNRDGLPCNTPKPCAAVAFETISPEDAAPQAVAAATGPQTIAPAPTASSFKLSGVMYGPSGPAAIINGHALQTGDQIEGARVMRIDSQSVLLTIDGQTLVVRL